MKIKPRDIKRYNKIAEKGRKPVMVRVGHKWYTWYEGDPKHGVFLTTQSGRDVEFDFKQIDDIEESIEKLTKSKLKEIIREEIQKLKEAEKLDLKKSYGVFLRGGSIGSGRGQYIDRKTDAKLVATYDSESEAKGRAKRSNGRLSPGEKKYYGMKYTAIKMSRAKLVKS